MVSFTIGEAFGESWKVTRANFGRIWGYLGMVWAVSFGFNIIVAFWGKEASAVASLIVMVLSVVLTLSFIRVMLMLVDKRETKLDDLFWFEAKTIWAYLVASVLYYLIVMGGLLLFIIPGIIWTYMFMMYAYAIADKGMGAVESLQYSRKLTRGNKGKIFSLMILVMLMNLGGALLLLLGLIVTVPLSAVIMAWTYRRLTSAAETAVDESPNS